MLTVFVGFIAHQVEEGIDVMLRCWQLVINVGSRIGAQVQGGSGLTRIEAINAQVATLVFARQSSGHGREPLLADLVSIPVGTGLIVHHEQYRTIFGSAQQRQAGAC